MSARLDLLWLGDDAPPPMWDLGAVRRAAASCAGVHAALARDTGADAWLIWDSALDAPPVDRLLPLLESPGDLWHGGLALGLGGAPGMIDFAAPTWTFNRDPERADAATSWRVSLRACLVRAEVVRWSLPDPSFASLDAMALEWGHRCIRFGALPRHAPLGLAASAPSISLEDEMRFLRRAFGARWAFWAMVRAMIAGYAPPEAIADAWLATRAVRASAPVAPYARARSPDRPPAPSVSVLIPTLDRPEYLRTILRQLRLQTVRAREVIVVDQAPAERRDPALAADFADLSLTVLALETAGQCTARNAGLLRARGDAILFVDDDDEIEPDLIARHLEHLAESGADVSSGVARERAAGPIPEAFTRARASDVFPTNNTLAKRGVLERSGLFDLAYDHGARADGDLGMRAYLSGAVMLLSPSIVVLHHHAPRGGLRTHGARVATYAGSRRRITMRNLPEVTEIYRALRYFSERQVREALAQSAAGTLSAHAGGWRRAAKALYGLVMMPHTLWQIRRRLRDARAMLARFPVIPTLPPRVP